MATSLPRRRKAVFIAALALVGTGVAAGLAELVLRMLPAPRQLGQLSYQVPDGRGGSQPIDFQQAVGQGKIVPVPWQAPRTRLMIAPSQDYWLCYTDNDVLHCDWLDAQGRVPVHNNKYGIRERDEIDENKPAGQLRILCLGDSFTFGWGIPVELGWVRMLENELRKTNDNVRTVNCGAAGMLCVDEYWCALQQRFHVLQPDAVVMTLCLNDLIPSSGLDVQGASSHTGWRLYDRLRNAFSRHPLDLDPTLDWVGDLLRLTKAEAEASGMAEPGNKPFEAMWSQGVPQRCMREAKAWCDARHIPFLVVIWPFLQGLGKDRWYPFTKLHELVAADCKAGGIPLLDVLPALKGTDDEKLWVTPADPHPNPLANRLALPSIVAFVREHTHW